jgi:hypothetical protein
LKQCKQAGVYVDWNMLFGFPGERVEDYERTLDLASLITHLQAPSSVGEIRLDRFSPNFEQAEQLGFANVRPWSLFRYVYPFDRATLMDLVYYFDCDRREAFDDHGYMGRIVEHVSGWRRRNDHLVAQRVNGSLVIHDSRPVGAARPTMLKGVHGDVYEYCDTRRTIAQIQEWLTKSHGRPVGAQKLRRLLDDLVARRLMVEEHGWYLSLALLPSDLAPAGAGPSDGHEGKPAAAITETARVGLDVSAPSAPAGRTRRVYPPG